MNAKELRDVVENIRTKRSTMLLLWQEQAENFYPERADFTYRRQPGTDFASNLMTSYPVITRRDLGDSFSTMLRPTNKEWAHVVPVDDKLEDGETKRWLQMATSTQRRAMYDPMAKFTIATKAGDHDYATFGQTALSIRLNRNQDALLYRCHHLRDMIWMDDEEGNICLVARHFKPTARALKKLFGDKIDIRVQQMIDQHRPFEQVECLHVVCEADMYDGNARGQKYWSIYIDITHDNKVLEEIPTWNPEYIIPRWSRPGDTQYAYSPATVAALPDARLIQAMTYTLLEAGEKIVNPPLIATEDAIRSDMGMLAGMVTWIDRDYDEKMGEALRPMNIDSKGMPLGRDMMMDSRQMIAAAFFLNKLTLPQRGPEMTAYEVGQRIQEYIRGALPLFEPMEMEYNGAVCKLTFEILRRHGAFGSINDMPLKLRNAPLQFRFESPLHDAIEQQKGQKFLEMGQLIAQAVAMDKRASAVPNIVTALREALGGIQTPATWIYTETETAKIVANQQAEAQAQSALAAAESASTTVSNLAGAVKDGAAAGPGGQVAQAA